MYHNLTIADDYDMEIKKPSGKLVQQQTIMNLFDSGIPPEIISYQLDVDLEEVNQTIQNFSDNHPISQNSLVNQSVVDDVSVFYLDALVDIQKVISNAQSSMWKALRSEPTFTAPFEETQKILSRYINNNKVKLIILNIDIVGSTKLSMTLPIERLSRIIQTFTQEMTKIIRLYGGYVLKYIGDAIIGFFNVNTSEHVYPSCINAINCARTMIKVIHQGFNPVLNQYDYPEMGVRIGIDYGENVVVRYLSFSENLEDSYNHLHNNIILKNKIEELDKTTKNPFYDILGYTISIATKMTAYAKVDHIIVGQLIYDILSQEEQEYFFLVDINSENWNYISDETGSIYKLYINKA